jgi:hypothetical protein
MRLILLLIAPLIALSAAHADEWPAPQIREVFSPSRAYFVRVNPGTGWGDTVGFAGSVKGPSATAEFYRLEKDRSYRFVASVSVRNPVAPVDVFVTNRGFLVTLDNWHNMGYGDIAAVYSPEGQLVKSYALSDLFNKSEIDGFSHSASSIWWRKDRGAYIRVDQETLYISVNDSGGGFVVNMSTGVYRYCETRSGNFLCRDSSSPRAWKSFREVSAGEP